jgi:hypothetical protein
VTQTDATTKKNDSEYKAPPNGRKLITEGIGSKNNFNYNETHSITGKTHYNKDYKLLKSK